jgi:hypothetical protein
VALLVRLDLVFQIGELGQEFALPVLMLLLQLSHGGVRVCRLIVRHCLGDLMHIRPRYVESGSRGGIPKLVPTGSTAGGGVQLGASKAMAPKGTAAACLGATSWLLPLKAPLAPFAAAAPGQSPSGLRQELGRGKG